MLSSRTKQTLPVTTIIKSRRSCIKKCCVSNRSHLAGFLASAHHFVQLLLGRCNNKRWISIWFQRVSKASDYSIDAGRSVVSSSGLLLAPSLAVGLQVHNHPTPRRYRVPPSCRALHSCTVVMASPSQATVKSEKVRRRAGKCWYLLIIHPPPILSL